MRKKLIRPVHGWAPPRQLRDLRDNPRTLDISQTPVFNQDVRVTVCCSDTHGVYNKRTQMVVPKPATQRRSKQAAKKGRRAK